METGGAISPVRRLRAKYAGGVYIPCAVFRRTPLERADQDLAWHRDDQWFFAAGACHILAYAFLETRSHRFTAKGLWPADAADPGHVYVSNGTWAFDHCGWTLERELLAVSRVVEPAANYQSRAIRMGLDELCARHWHRTRAEFLHDPWPLSEAPAGLRGEVREFAIVEYASLPVSTIKTAWSGANFFRPTPDSGRLDPTCRLYPRCTRVRDI